MDDQAPLRHPYPSDAMAPLLRPRPPVVRRRLWLHVVLLAATAVTATVFGAWFWAESYREFGELVARPSLALPGLPYALCLLLILGAHEMGHYLACRHYGIPATLPYFLPGLPPFGTFGAVIRIRGVIPDRRVLFDIAAAGPIAGFAVALPVLLIGIARVVPIPDLPAAGDARVGEPLVSALFAPWLLPPGEAFRPGAWYGAGWVGMLVTSMNLFPVGQLDGGHAAYAWSARMHRTLSRATIALLFALVVFQAVFLRTLPAYVLWLTVLLFMRDRHPRLADEATPIGPGRKAVALVLAVLFGLTFIPIPLLFL